jgi:hypothetical protein
MLNLPVHGPPRPPTRSSAPSSSTRTPRTARPAPSPPTSSPCGRPTPSCAATAPAWRPSPGPTSRRSWPTRSPAASAYHKVLKILYGWFAEEERFPPTRSCPPTRHPQGRTSWCPGGLEPPASGLRLRTPALCPLTYKGKEWSQLEPTPVGAQGTAREWTPAVVGQARCHSLPRARRRLSRRPLTAREVFWIDWRGWVAVAASVGVSSPARRLRDRRSCRRLGATRRRYAPGAAACSAASASIPRCLS